MKTTTKSLLTIVPLAAILTAYSAPAQAMGKQPATGVTDPANPNPASQPPTTGTSGNPGSPTPSAAGTPDKAIPPEIYNTNGAKGSSGGIQSPGMTNPASTSGTGTSGTSTSGTAR